MYIHSYIYYYIIIIFILYPFEHYVVAVVEYAKTYNFSQRENDTSVQLCAKLVGEGVEIPVSAALYLVSGTAKGMWWPAWWGSTGVTGLELRFATFALFKNILC